MALFFLGVPSITGRIYAALTGPRQYSCAYFGQFGAAASPNRFAAEELRQRSGFSAVAVVDVSYQGLVPSGTKHHRRD